MKNLNSFTDDAQRKHRKPKSLFLLRAEQFAFAFLSFAFTLISAWNGYHFYLINFGLSPAIIITTAFEIARFASLFRYIRRGRKNNILSAFLYLLTAVVCAFSSINSFSTGVVLKNQTKDTTIDMQVFQVKQTYAKKMAGEIDKASKDIQYMKNMAARFPNRSYWKVRLTQAIEQKENLTTERDGFLATVPQDPKKWIEIQAAILDMKIVGLSKEDKELAAVNTVLEELWGIDRNMAQKIIGIVLTVTVEISIFILAMLATQDRRGKKRGKNGKANGILEHYDNEEERETVENFFRTSLEAFVKTGKLPPLSKTNKNLRPLGRYLRNLDPAFLRDLLQSQESVKSDP